MTRYKELRRAQRAIADGNLQEPQWAERWATMRLKLATRRVQKAMREVSE